MSCANASNMHATVQHSSQLGAAAGARRVAGIKPNTNNATRWVHESRMSHFEGFVWKRGQMRLMETQCSQQQEDGWRRLWRRIPHGILRAICA